MGLERLKPIALKRRLMSIFAWRRTAALKELARRGEEGKLCWTELLRRMHDRNAAVSETAREVVRSLGISVADTALTHYNHLTEQGPAVTEFLCELGTALYPLLKEAQHSPSEAKRWSAADVWAAMLGDLNHHKRAKHALLHSLYYEIQLRGENGYFIESPPRVILRAREALGALGPAMIPELRRRFHHHNELVSREILATLAAVGIQAVESIVDLGFTHPDRLLRNCARSLLQQLGPASFAELMRLVSSRTPAVRAEIIETWDCKAMRSKAGVIAPEAALLLGDPDSKLREFAAWFLISVKLRASGEDDWALSLWRHSRTAYPALKQQLAQARKQWRGHRPPLLGKITVDNVREGLQPRAERVCAATLAALNDTNLIVREAALWCLAIACEYVPSDRREAIERALVLSGMSAADPDEHDLLSDALARLGNSGAPPAKPTRLVLTHYAPNRSVIGRLVERGLSAALASS